MTAPTDLAPIYLGMDMGADDRTGVLLIAEHLDATDAAMRYAHELRAGGHAVILVESTPSGTRSVFASLPEPWPELKQPEPLNVAACHAPTRREHWRDRLERLGIVRNARPKR